jgi:hypothetical protein
VFLGKYVDAQKRTICGGYRINGDPSSILGFYLKFGLYFIAVYSRL